MALASISKCAAFRGMTGHFFLRLLRPELRRWLAFAVMTIWAAGGWSGAVAEEKLQVLQHHVRPAVAQGKAQMKSAMAPDAQLNISIVLPLRDEAGLDRLLARLYDPSSPDYRQFLSVAEFTRRFGPTQEDYATVVAFAQSNGLEVTENPENRLVVPLRGTVAAINKALHVQMAVYQHPAEQRTFFSPDREPSLALSVPVAHVSGLNDYSQPKPMVERGQRALGAAAPTGSGLNGSYLASDMRTAYYGGTKLTGAGQAVGLLEFGGYYQSDVDETFNEAGQTYSVPVVNVLLDGASADPQGADDSEQVLDIVQAIGMAPGLSQVRVYIGRDDASLLNAMASENAAKSLSCSWSWLPEDPGAVDVFFKEMAAQGQSFFAASGDYGAFDWDVSPYFFPQEDAYVTAVGGTHLTTGPGGTWSAETSWNSPPYGSGGGVSPDGIPIASWQSGVATTANGGSSTLRNVPDVAMEADFDNFSCAYGECFTDYAGTSFAAPRWAGFMALVNQQAVQDGSALQGGVGFINPAIYAIGAGSRYSSDFHDTTTGNNQTLGQPVWYPAEPLYDLVTGWGSPAGQDLIDDLAGAPASAFSIAASSGSLAMNPGASASTTIQVLDSVGFSGAVHLAVTSPLPSGVTAKWSKNPATTNSVLTLTAASSVANITAPVTITGTSGSLVQSTQVSLTVHTPSFSVGAYPDSVWLVPGGSIQTDVYAAPLYGFTGNVQLGVSGLPKGVTATFGTNPTSGQSLLTLRASSTATPGSSNVIITGTSGTVTATATLPVHVVTPAFELATVQNFSMGPGTANSLGISVFGEYGFSAPVTLSVSGLPSGVTGSFAINPITNYGGWLTLTASATAALGTSTVTVTGKSGSQTATSTFKLNLVPPAIALSTTGGLDMERGSSVTQTVYVSPLYGFNGSVKLAVTGLPTGVTASLAPTQTTSLSLLTLKASSTAPLGPGVVTVTGTAGSLTASTSFPLGIYTPSFSLSTDGSISLGTGTSTSTQVYIKPINGFLGSVNLAVSGLPSGVTASFSPKPTTGTTVLTLTASSAATTGLSALTIIGESGQLVQKEPLTLQVVNPGFKLVAPQSMTVGTGSTATAPVTITPQDGFAGSVTLSATGLPSGVTATFLPNPMTGVTAATVTLSANSSAKPGQYSVMLTGTAASQTATASFPLTVAAPGFQLTSAGTVMLGQGKSATTTITMTPTNGFTGSVQLAVSGLPPGVTASLLPDLTTGMSTLTLTASSAVVAGSSNITLTGTSGTLKATTIIPLKVSTPSFTLAPLNDTTIPRGGSMTVPVQVNPAYGFTGSVAFSTTGLPAGVGGVFSPNPTSTGGTLTLTASSTAAVGVQTVKVVGVSGSIQATSSFALNVQAQTLQLANLGTVQLAAGGSATATVNAFGNWADQGGVIFAVAGLPSGVTASFSPNPSSSQSVMTLSAASNVATGSFTVNLTGTVGKTTGAASFVLQVGTPAFTVQGPQILMLSQGGKITGNFFYWPQFGFSGTVQFSITGLPAGVTGAWSQTPQAGYSVMTLTASPTATVVGTTATVTATSGALKVSVPLQVVVVPPLFSLNSYGPVNLSRGQSGSATVNVSSTTGFRGNVTLSLSGLPSGVTASFAPPTTNSNSVLTLTASTTAALGECNLVVTGTSGQVSVTTVVTVLVTQSSASFQVSGPAAVQVGEGSSTASNVSVVPMNGFTGSVHLSAAGLPKGVTASFLPNPTTGDSSMTLTAANPSTLGEYTARVVGTYVQQTASIPIDVTVSQPAFSLAGYLNQPLSAGSSGQGTVYVQPHTGFTGSVQLSVTGLPAGVTASFSLNPVVDSTQLTLTTTSNVKPGQYNVTVRGVSGSLSATTNLQLEIDGPSFSLQAQDFSLGRSSSSSGYVGVTLNNGFAGAVQLSVTGLPAGVTASFAANPVTANTTLVLTASGSASVGQYTAVLTGKSGSQTVTTPFSVTVTATSFSVNGPSSLDIGIGGSIQASFYLQSESALPQNAQFSVTGLPSGVSGIFSPNPTTYSTSLGLAATQAAIPGHYTVTVTGTLGTQSSRLSFTLNVGQPGFTISNYGVNGLGQGGSTTTQVYVNGTFGFSGAVQFSLSGLPAGVTGTFAPASSTYYSTLTLTASSTAAAGTYQPVIVGTAGSLSASSPLTLTVGTPSFTLNGGGTLQVGEGSSASTYAFISSQFGFSGKVSFSASGLPAGVTASFSPNPTANLSQMTVAASSSAAPGEYAFTLTGTSGSLRESVPMYVNIVRSSLGLYGGGVAIVGRGSSGSTWVNIDTSQGFRGNVQLAAANLPTGVTASFSPNPTATSSTINLTAASTAPLGQYDFTVTGTSGVQTATISLPVRIVDPTFTLSSNGEVSLGQGSSGNGYLFVNTEYGFTGQVQMVVKGLPAGVTASFSSNPATSSTTITLTAASTAPLGEYNITVTGTSGTKSASTTFPIAIYAPTFSLWTSGNLTIGQGTHTTTDIDVGTQYGFQGNVQLTVTGLPQGVTGVFSPNPATSYSTLTLTAASTAQLGLYNVIVTGTSGQKSASTMFQLGVYTPTFSLGPLDNVALGQGNTFTEYVPVNPLYGFSGNVQLALSGLPKGVTGTLSFNANSGNTLTLTAASTAPVGQYNITITGTSGSQKRTASFTLGVYVPTFTLGSYSGVQLSAGQTGYVDVFVSGEYGFTGNVQLSASGLPDGVTAAFSPNPASYYSAMALTAGSSVTPGSYTVTVHGTAGSQTVQTTIPLMIQ